VIVLAAANRPEIPMKAAVFEGHERIVLEARPFPSCRPNDAIVKVTLTTICGTDLRIWRAEYPSAQGPIGLCGTAGARLKGAALVIGVDTIEKRLQLSRELGADVVLDFTQEDPVAAIKRLTDGRGVDVAIEALGKHQTFRLDQIEDAYQLFGNQRDDVLKVALRP
jgi:threonine dehydrogenase-like Zn-dependent dehydrogenase